MKATSRKERKELLNMTNINTDTTKNKQFVENIHEKVINSIQYFIDLHGAAYPSITRLAEQADLKPVDLLRVLAELESAGRIKKTARFDPIKQRKSSNLYEIIQPVDKPKKKAYFIKSLKKAKEKVFKKILKSSTADELNIEHYKQQEFFEIARERGIPEEITRPIFRRIKNALLNTSLFALSLTFSKLEEYAATISHPPAWFETVLCNMNNMLRI